MCVSITKVAGSLLLAGMLTWSFASFSQQADSKSTLLAELAQLEGGTRQRIPVLVKLVKACWRACAADAKGYAQEALALLDVWPDVQQETALLVYMPRLYQRDGLHQEAQVLVERGLIAANKLGDKRKLASIQFNQAMLYGDEKKFILAENAYQQLYQTYKELDYANGIGSTLNNLGFIQKRSHNFGKALEYYQQALQIYELGGVVHNAASTLGNIGEVYTQLGDYETAELSILKAKEMIKVDEYPDIYISISSRLSDLYIATNRYAEATALMLKTLQISKQSHIKLSDPDIYAKLVNVELLQNNLERAEHYYQLGLTSYSQQTLDKHYIGLDQAAAKLRIAQNKLSEAEAILAPVIPEIRAGYTSDSALSLLASLIEVKKSQGKWQEGFELQALYHDKYQEQVQANRESRLEQFDILYQASEKERLIAELEQENSVKSIEVLTEQAARRQVIFVAALVAIFLFVVIHVGMQKRKLLLMQTNLLQADAEKKTRLFSDISHELRTPLSVLKLQIEGLEHDLVDDPKKTYKLLHAKLASINHLITDISQLAQADAGDLPLTFEPIHIREFFLQWCTGAKALTEQKGLNFVYSVNVSEDQLCYMDSERIKQVLNNLLSNSCRYTDTPGCVEFKVRIHKGMLQWLIQDSAPGLKPEQLKQIFERLYRADKSRSRKSGGSGLGLSICKSLIEAHHGRISAEPSELGGICIKVQQQLAGRRVNRG